MASLAPCFASRRSALIEVDHGPDRDDEPSAFRLLLTFDEPANGKTVVTLRQMRSSKARRH